VRPVARVVCAVAALVAVLLVPVSALACSPVQDPTIAALGPEQVVLLGVTGDKVPSGRVFHVQRAWNGDVPSSPIVIAFQEGEPIGDCSYPVASGTRLVLAPERAQDGALSANLATLQADPLSEAGRRYLAEAEQLFGPGTVPIDTYTEPPLWSGWPLVLTGAGLVIALVVALVVRRRVRSA
jgi:hypothetical protein